MLTLVIVLALLLTSCAGSPDVIERPVAPPPIDWPAFPDPHGFVDYSEDGETVMLDTEYWVQLAEWALDMNAAMVTYERFRELYAEK